MSFYLDTNFIVSLFFDDAHSQRTHKWMESPPRSLSASAWLETEFHALVGRRERIGAISADIAGEVRRQFKADILDRGERLALTASAGVRAAALARDPVLKLSAADALHLALCVDHGRKLVTFDARLATAVVVCGCAVENI